AALAALPLLPLAGAGPVRAEPLPLARIDAYLAALSAGRARFEQINPDGSRLTGTLSFRRPGRARFEYDPPAPALIVASGQALAVFDLAGGGEPAIWPIRQTPLWLILGPEPRLSGSDAVIGVEERGPGMTAVRLRDPDRPELGTVELLFRHEPLELAGWVVTDEGGSPTATLLGPIERDAPLPERLFSIQAEKARLAPDDGAMRP
ncbi:MAG: outer membrane lipoprotein carrier protein LolA, partial [Alphaproteobacteria bacterium]